MIHPALNTLERRHFFQVIGGLAAGALSASWVRAEDLPENTNPTAISGDSVEPDWRQRMTVTVGPDKADLVGATDRVIQAGVDYVARMGGGTVQILPGTYRLRNSIFLQSKVRLLGSGTDSILVKEPTQIGKLALDGDHWDQEITLADAGGFQVGDGVRIVSEDPYGKGINLIQRTLIASSGNRFKLDSRLKERFHLSGEPTIGTNFSLLQCTDVTDVVVENVALDGNKAHNERVDRGKYDDGCIRLDSSHRITMRDVTLRNFYCDGIVWGIAHDVRVENCRLIDGARLAIHAGSGSQRSIVRGNRVERGQQGIYFCWGAQHGLYEKNVFEGCDYGITLGHRDTDNLIRDNDIRSSRVAGILFRDQEEAFSPSRNRIEKNRIVDSGGDDGIGIDVSGHTKSVTLSMNEIRETRKPLSRIGIRIGSQVRDIHCLANTIDGFATAISDLRNV